MGATSRNIIKLISGSAVGAGVGALLARGAETTAKHQEAVVVIPPATEPAGVGVTAVQPPPAQSQGIGAKVESLKDQGQNKVIEIRNSLRDRWRRAQEEGDKAKEDREAELRAYFREKVNDPTAFPPGAPTRTDR